MREDLLGYLLGALEPNEMERVERALRDDPVLRRQLDQVRRLLRPLEEAEEADAPQFEPPAGLVGRTMELIDSVAPDPDAPLVSPAAHDRFDEKAGSGRRQAGAQGNAHRSDRSSAAAALGASADASRAVGGAPRWRWWDTVVSGMAAVALIGIVLPAILRGRFEARKTVCQDHMRATGLAIMDYVLRDPQQHLPQLATEGPEAFSGVYAVRLRDADLIESASTLWCPSVDLPASLPALPPTLEQLHAAAMGPLRGMQRSAGGSYAYNLGVVDSTGYHSPRYQGRTSFAILGDAPTSAGDGRPVQVPHDQLGVNLLYEDGHVSFVPVDALGTAPDPPFLNHRGAVEAGVGADDAALAPSWRPPFRHVRQR